MDQDKGRRPVRSSAADRAVLSALGAGLTVVGLGLLGLVLSNPSLLTALPREALQTPLVPVLVALLGVCALLLDRSPWFARIGASLVGLGCLAPFGLPERGAPFRLWEGGEWWIADARLWLGSGAACLFLATFRGRAATSLVEALSVGTSLAATLAGSGYVFSVASTLDRALMGFFILLVAHVCASAVLRHVASREGFWPSVETPQANRFLAAATGWAPFLAVAAGSVSLVLWPRLALDPSVYVSGLIVVPFVVAVVSALLALEDRERAASELALELRGARIEEEIVESVGAFGVWTLDPLQDLLVVSGPSGRILGTDCRRGSAQNLVDCAAPEDAESVGLWLDAARHAEGRSCTRFRSGERRLELCAERRKSGGYPLVYGTVRDVTEESREREALAERLSLLERATASHPDAMYVANAQTRETLFWNRPVGELFGDTGTDVFAVMLRHTSEGHRSALSDHLAAVALSGEGESGELEFQAVSDAGPIWVRHWARVLTQDESGRALLVSGMVREVTEERSMLQQLHESEERYERLSARSPGVIYQLSLAEDGTASILFISEACQSVFGVSREEAMADAQAILGRIHEEDCEAMMQAVERSRNDLTDATWTGRYVRPDGRTVWIHAASRPRKLEDKSTVWDGIALDVTAEREAQAALEQTKERLDLLLSESPTVVYGCEPSAPYRVASVADNVRNLIGFVPEQIVGRPLFGTEFVHESDRELFGMHQRRFVDHGRSSVEYRLRTISGDYVWVRDEVRIVPTSQDRPDVLGTWTDISAQRKSMERTVESEARLQRLASRVPGMLFELELAEEVRPVFHYVSTGSYDLIGVPPEELRARPETFFRMIDGEDRARLYRDLVRTDRELTDLDWEGRLTLIGGREKWVRVTGRPVESAEGAVKWTAVAMDVTESRQSSGSLAEADARLSAILNSLGDAVVTVDEEGTVRSVNTAYERLSGVPAHEAVGRTLDGTLEIASSGAGTRRLQVLTRPDGSRATVEVTTVVHNLGGRQFVTGIVRERPEPIVAEARAVVTLPEEAPRASRGVVIASEQDVETYRLPGVVLDEAHVVAATTVGMGLELAKRLAPDVLALVSGLPDVDLASVVEAVRSEDSLQGVWIIVTGVPESAFPRLHRAGADECVVEKGDTPRVLSQALAKVGHTGI